MRGVRRGFPREKNKLEMIVPLPLPDDDAGGVPAINGGIYTTIVSEERHGVGRIFVFF